MVSRADIIPAKLLPVHIESPPSCTSRESFDDWYRASTALRGNVPKQLSNAGFCSACTPVFQRRMRTAGLCDHFEEIRFNKHVRPMLISLVRRTELADKIVCAELGL